MSELKDFKSIKECPRSYVLAVNDTLNVLSGKWKIPIIASLHRGKKRFKDLQNSIDKITPRMLSKELKELELNGVVKRTVHSSQPVLIEYELTSCGMPLIEVIDAMVKWGLNHRSFAIRED